MCIRDSKKIASDIEVLFQKEKNYPQDYYLIKKDKSKISIEIHGSPIRNDEGKLTGFRGIILDITERKEYESKIKYLSFHDKLTDLYNRAYFEEELKRLNNKRNLPISIIIGDVNNLKVINDTFGHQEGDRVLQKTALMLKSFEKKHEGSLAARYGGEEFVFVMQGANLRAAAAAAEEIRAYAGKNISGGNGKEQRRITLSIGVASLPETAKSQRELIKNADEMLYAAKEQGRDRVVWREG